MRLAARLRSDPLRGLQRSPNPLATLGEGVLLLRVRGGRGKKRGRREREVEGERDREGTVRGGDCLLFNKLLAMGR